MVLHRCEVILGTRPPGVHPSLCRVLLANHLEGPRKKKMRARERDHNKQDTRV